MYKKITNIYTCHFRDLQGELLNISRKRKIFDGSVPNIGVPPQKIKKVKKIINTMVVLRMIDD